MNLFVTSDGSLRGTLDQSQLDLYDWSAEPVSSSGENVTNNSVTTDNLDNVYVTGSFQGETVFTHSIPLIERLSHGGGTLPPLPLSDLNIEATLENSGGSDMHIAKYDSNGQFQWARKAGGPSNDKGLSLTTDSENNIYVVGSFSGEISFGGNQETLISAGESDLFVAKYDDDGNFLWVKNAGNVLSEETPSLKIDSFGNIYVTGSFSGEMSFEGSQETLTSAGGTDIFVAVYNGDWQLQRAFRAGGTLDEKAYSLSTDNLGNVYVTGSFIGEMSFEGSQETLISAGGTDIFIAVYDKNGQLQRTHRVGGSSDDSGYLIEVDDIGRIYLLGSYKGTIEFQKATLNETDTI